MREWADYITAKFDKDILIMETGYSWDKDFAGWNSGTTVGQRAVFGFLPAWTEKTSCLNKLKK